MSDDFTSLETNEGGKVKLTYDAVRWAARVEERIGQMNDPGRETTREMADFQRECAEAIRDRLRGGKTDWDGLDIVQDTVWKEIEGRVKNMTAEDFRVQLEQGTPKSGMIGPMVDDSRYSEVDLPDLVGLQRVVTAGMSGAWSERTEASAGPDIKTPGRGSLENNFNAVASRMAGLVQKLS